ncbi:MAG: 5'-methylthioadenosine/S-adenosylhomocysteine nucleosidase [Clostridia bacterium]|nr:5'-methylthioadenosine/S-adenosylhomocysteine nucleosidase [Clostridia bacterium]
MENLKIGIVVADNDEYKPLADIIENGNFENYSFLKRIGHKFYIETENGRAEVVSILSGIGKVNATAAAMHLVDIGCNCLLNFGLSGGISGVRRNDLCFTDRFLEHDFDLSGIGYKPCEKPSQKYIYDANKELLNIAKSVIPNAKIGTAVSGDKFICDAKTRDFFKEEFNAMSCDMETAAIAYIADFSDVPLLCLRRISDDAGDDALETYREMNTSGETVLADYIIEIIKAIIESYNYEK